MYQAPRLSAPRDFIKKILSRSSKNRKELFYKVTEQYFHFFIETFKNCENKRKLEKMTILPSGSAGSFKKNESIFNKIIQPMY